MRWLVFALFAFAFLVAELSLKNLLVLRSLGGVAPSFVFVLLVFVSFYAPRWTALWAAWVLGLLVDLTTPIPQGAGEIGPIIGPHALGYVAASAVVIQIRSMLLRRRALTLAVVTMAAFAIASLVAVVLYAVHRWYPTDHLIWANRPLSLELLRRLANGVYSGVLALVLNPVLVWTIPVWAFRSGR